MASKELPKYLLIESGHIRKSYFCNSLDTSILTRFECGLFLETDLFDMANDTVEFFKDTFL